MNFLQLAHAGYNGATSQEPPYASSPNGMAFQCGVWARKSGIDILEIKQGRGYTWIINRQYKLNFKDDDYSPKVSSI